jgi:SnoaL-like domain
MSENFTTVITYLRAVERSDWDAAAALFSDTATVWHNDGKGDETREQYFDGLKTQVATYDSVHYDITRQLAQPGGVLQQHVVRVVGKNGERGGVYAAVYFGFDGAGLISRIEAYANFIPDERTPPSGASVPGGRARGDILDVLTSYVFALDRRDFAGVAAAFTDDAVVRNSFDAYMPEGEDFGSVTIGGTAVAEGARRLFGTLDATQHLLGAQTVDVGADGVRASTQIVAHHHRGGDFFHTGGTYEDEFVRTSEGWRISRRTLQISWTTGTPTVFAP